jgi:hypothetical protein
MMFVIPKMSHRCGSVFIALLTTSVLLSGCGIQRYEWKKDGAGPAEFDVDYKECVKVAESIPRASDYDLSNNYLRCMQGRGWYQSEVD